MKKLLCLALLSLLPVSYASADLKIAVVDLSKAFSAYYKTKDATARLNEKAESFEKDIQDMKTDYDHMMEDAQKLNDKAKDPTLSQAAKDDAVKALQAKVQDLRNMEQKINETGQERKKEMDDEKMRRHNEICAEISKVVTDYSSTQGFDLVLDKSVNALTGVPFVMFSSSKMQDITGEIIQRLNSSAPAGGTTAAPSGAGSGQ